MSAGVRAIALLLAVALLAVVAGCGIPKDGEPRLIAEEPDLPTTTDGEATGARTVQVYLIDARAQPPTLAARSRAATQIGPLAAVNALLSSPPDSFDESNDYQTRIPPGTELLPGSRISADGTTVVLDLSEELTITGEVAVQAYAQLVYTATEYEPKLVRFFAGGDPIPVPTETETKDVVTRADYQSLRPDL